MCSTDCTNKDHDKGSSGPARLPLKEMDPSLLLLELLDYYPEPQEQELVCKAAALASRAHRGQTRATRRELPKDLYITHPLRVAVRLNRMGLRSATLTAAAICHDVIEDCEDNLAIDYPTKTPEEVVTDLLGDTVCSVVKTLSIAPGDNRPYVEKVADVLATSEPRWVIKTSDLMDNAGSLKFFPEGESRLRKARKYNLALHLVLETCEPELVCRDCWLGKLQSALTVTEAVLQNGA